MFVVKDYALAAKGSEHVVYRRGYVLLGWLCHRAFSP